MHFEKKLKKSKTTLLLDSMLPAAGFDSVDVHAMLSAASRPTMSKRRDEGQMTDSTPYLSRALPKKG